MPSKELSQPVAGTQNFALGSRVGSGSYTIQSADLSQFDTAPIVEASHPVSRTPHETVAEQQHCRETFKGRSSVSIKKNDDIRKKDSSINQKRGKKPDIQIYVPKPRQQVLTAKDQENASETFVYPDNNMGPSSEPVSNLYDGQLMGMPTTTGPKFQARTDIGKQHNGSQPSTNQRVSVPLDVSCPSADSSRPNGQRNKKPATANSRSRGRGSRQPNTKCSSGSEELEGEQLEWDHKADFELGDDEHTSFRSWESEERHPPRQQSLDNEAEFSNDDAPRIDVEMKRKRRNRKRGKTKLITPAVKDNNGPAEADVRSKDIACVEDSPPVQQSVSETSIDKNKDSFTGSFEGMVITNSRLDGNEIPTLAVAARERGERDSINSQSGRPRTSYEKKSSTNRLTSSDFGGRQQRIEKPRKGRRTDSEVDKNEKCSKERSDQQKTRQHQNTTEVTAKTEDEREKFKSTNRTNSSSTSSAHIGGIIRLPVGTTAATSGGQLSDRPHHSGAAIAIVLPVKGQSQRGGRAVSHRTLWDPSQPTCRPRPTDGSSAKPLHFQDEMGVEPPVYQQVYAAVENDRREYEYKQQQHQQHGGRHPYYNAPPYGDYPGGNPHLTGDNYIYSYPIPCYDVPSTYPDDPLNQNQYYQGQVAYTNLFSSSFYPFTKSWIIFLEHSGK